MVSNKGKEGRKEGSGVCARTGKLSDSAQPQFMHILFSIVIATIFAGYDCCDFDVRCCDSIQESTRLDSGTWILDTG